MLSTARQRGATIIEMIVVMGLMTVVMASAAYLASNYFNSSKASTTAQHMSLVANAASNYISNNPSAFSAATATSPVMLQVATLIGSGDIKNPDFSNENAFGQKMCVLVLQPSAGNFTALLVTEGGSTIGGGLLGEIVGQLGAGGGAIYTNKLNEIRGAGAIWKLAAPTAYENPNSSGKRCDGSTSGAVAVTLGHPVVALWMSAAATANQSVLYRNKITGQDHLNEMNTPLVMNATKVAGADCSDAKLGAIAQNTSQTGLVMCGSNLLWNVVGHAVSGITPAGACSTGGMLGTTAGGVGYTCNGSYWVQLQNFANPAGACTTAGETALSLVNGEALVCKNSRYIRILSLLPLNAIQSKVPVQSGSVVTKPVCDTGGTAKYSLELTQTVVDVSVNPPRQAMYTDVTDQGASWLIRFYVKTSAGTPSEASYLSPSALFHTECAY